MCIGLYHDWIYLSVDMDFVQSRIHIISMCFFTAFRQDCVYPCLSSTLPLYKLLFRKNKTQKVLVCELFFVFLELISFKSSF